eukprot:g23337.t1
MSPPSGEDAPAEQPGEALSTLAAAPKWSIPRASREGAKKVHLSKKHQLDRLGVESPGPGAYTPLRQRKSPSCSFGTRITSGEWSTPFLRSDMPCALQRPAGHDRFSGRAAVFTQS